MPKTPIAPQFVADLVEAARHPASGPPVIVNAAPGATVIIYAGAPASPSPDAPMGPHPTPS